MRGVYETWWQSARRMRFCVVVAAIYLYFAISLAIGQETPLPAPPPPGGTPSDPPSDPPTAPIPAPASPEATANQITGPAEQLLQEVEAIADKLAAAGDKTTAEAFRAEAANIRGRDGKTFEFPKADPYAVHAVYLNEAGPPPPGFGTGADRFTTRYAEVQVGELAQPTVLVLTSSVKKLHWHVTKHPSTRLLAVVVDALNSTNISGLDDSTVVVSANHRDGSESPSWPDPDVDVQDGYRSMRTQWSALTGASVLTINGQNAKPGTPVVIAPDQPEFRQQIATRRARALYRRATNASTTPVPFIPAELANHTFHGIHYLVYQGGQYASAGTAEFTLRGPKAASLQHRHGRLTNFITDNKENLDFALSGNGLVLLGEGIEEFESIPFDANEASLANLLSLTFDAARRRIVAATDAKALYEYDLKLATWSKLEETEYPLSSVSYVPELDCFYAFSSDGSDRRDERRGIPRRAPEGAAKTTGLRMLKLSPQGKILAVVREGITPAEWPGSGRHHTQVAYADGKIALFGGCRDSSSGDIAAPVLLLDAESGKTLYAGSMTPWTEAPEIKRTLPVARQLPTPTHRAGRFVRDLYAVEIGIEQLRKAGETDKADRAAKRLAFVQRIMNGGASVAGAAVHLVGCYQHKNAEIRITETTKPVTVVLCAYDPGTWKITLAEGAKMERVIVGGYHKQKVTGLPEGTPVDYHVYEQGGGADYFYTYHEDSDGHARAMQMIRELTGSIPTTMQTRYEFKDEVIEIGPRSPEWRLQHATPLLNALAAPFVAQEQSARLAQLPDWKFRAARRDATRRDDVRRRGGFGGGAKTPPSHNDTEWLQFSLRGPSEQLQITLPDGITNAVLSDDPELSFGWQDGEVVQFNSKTGKTTPTAALDDSLGLSPAAPIVIDSKRQRLLFVREPLTEYDIKARKWSIIRKQTLGGSSIAYSSRDDRLYLLSANNPNWDIDHYSVSGVRMKHLSLPFTPPEGASTSASQLVEIGDFLGIVSPGVEIVSKNIRVPGRVLVINPDDGALVYSGLLTQRLAERKLSADELKDNWERLAEDSADIAQERLASGGDAAVKFIAAQLVPPREYKPDEIAKLIEDLGHEKLDAREKAERQLALIGQTAEAALRAAESHESPEVRARVRKLLAGLGDVANNDPATRRQVRAMDILGRIGSAEALEVLQQAAFEPATSAVSVRAQFVLACIGEGGEPLRDAFSENDTTGTTRERGDVGGGPIR